MQRGDFSIHIWEPKKLGRFFEVDGLFLNKKELKACLLRKFPGISFVDFGECDQVVVANDFSLKVDMTTLRVHKNTQMTTSFILPIAEFLIRVQKMQDNLKSLQNSSERNLTWFMSDGDMDPFAWQKVHNSDLWESKNIDQIDKYHDFKYENARVLEVAETMCRGTVDYIVIPNAATTKGICAKNFQGKMVTVDEFLVAVRKFLKL